MARVYWNEKALKNTPITGSCLSGPSGREIPQAAQQERPAADLLVKTLASQCIRTLSYLFLYLSDLKHKY